MEQVNLGYLSGIIGTVAGLTGAVIGTYFEMRRAKQGKDYKFFGLFFGLWLLMRSALIKANRLIGSVQEQNASAAIPEIVVVEEMSKETAKQKVLKHMGEHKKSDVIELHKNVRCDIRLLVEIIDELRREGKIEED